MAIKQYKPTTPGRRFASVDAFSDITKNKPEKSLVMAKSKSGGRNNQGKLTMRHRGGGAKRKIRIVDMKREKFDVPAKILAIEYDPGRNARIALLKYADGEKNYIIAPDGVRPGDSVVSSKSKGNIAPGNRFSLEHIPIGILVHAVEFEPGRGAQFARAAGTFATLAAVEGRFAQLRLPSGEARLVPRECMATIGQVSNVEAWRVRLGKAGRMRHRGIKPTVRGKAMNPVDHPHGGGEGHNPIGLTHPKTPWGKHAFGVKTRSQKPSDKLILQRRKK